MKNILVATGNNGKIKEISSIIKSMKIKEINLLGLFDVGLSGLKPVENGNTFYQNAYKKAVFYYEKSNMPVIAEDSGLVVPSLNGEPGVISARYYFENATDEDNRRFLLKKMEGIKDRAAYFEAVVIFFDGKNLVTKTGRCYGYITEEERGNNGFGYDPIFFSPQINKTFGEAKTEEKNRISHRYIATRDLFEELKFLEII
ncbi:MAG TPA: RdgB/HAM1 family non-canonical purine NTP pyrophosphatase [Spirochaetota bacterium]|nr:RdgB/HAM1 family non-canonical purine NTP pyrophosphatase [Spirochaetota bacterium]HOM38632.1 RdgB/HAM1 family non-canonical purine NTP pyrophosphatase [Spirochaetota bacterium]HPQ49769.1 RdgB/HAM1 family non-canonical purine NTP pyrophosphatase [Spirochaetota bacterium]